MPCVSWNLGYRCPFLWPSYCSLGVHVFEHILLIPLELKERRKEAMLTGRFVCAGPMLSAGSWGCRDLIGQLLKDMGTNSDPASRTLPCALLFFETDCLATGVASRMLGHLVRG